MKRSHSHLMASILLVVGLTSVTAWAQDSKETINYQGTLADSGGIPVADGTYTAIFELFDTDSPAPGETALWSSPALSFDVLEGVFDVQLGAQAAFPAGLFDEYDDLHLRITIEGEEFAPLQHLTSAPYAMKANIANHAHTATSADSILTGTVTGDLLVGGRVGVGETQPAAELHVVMSSGGTIPSLLPGLVIEDANLNVGSRMEIRDENGVAEFRIDGTGDLVLGGDAKIGVGTPLPEAQLHVVMPDGRAGIPPTFSTVGGLVVTDGTFNSANQVEIQDAQGAARVVVDAAGRVGIGTADPDASLVISGNGNDPPAGFLILRNEHEDAGIRIYDGDDFNNDVKHHIYNDNVTSLNADALRIAPQGSFDQGGITVLQNGNVGIGTTNPFRQLTVVGRTRTDVLEITGGADLSEGFDVRSARAGLPPAPGMVVSIDPDTPGSLIVSSDPYDKKVAGIISGAGGVNPGMLMGQEDSEANGSNPVALTGRVYCRADASKGAIQPGDLLTTSDIPGHAMKVMDHQRAQGAIIGKAMTGLEEDEGLVLVLVTLQ